MFGYQTYAARFEALLRPHLDHLYRVAYRFSGNGTDAEDLVQDLLVKLYPRVAELGAVEQLQPWLTRALYHQFIDAMRRHARTPLGRRCAIAGDDEDGDILDTLPGNGHDPEAATECALTRERLARAFDGLSAEHRAVVALHDIEGYRLEEMSGLLDAPIGTLKSRLHRARQQLRIALSVEPDVPRLRVNQRG